MKTNDNPIKTAECNGKVIGKIKKFNQLLYEKYDTPARNKVKEKL